MGGAKGREWRRGVGPLSSPKIKMPLLVLQCSADWKMLLENCRPCLADLLFREHLLIQLFFVAKRVILSDVGIFSFWASLAIVAAARRSHNGVD